MNTQDRIIEILLTTLDRLLDALSLGWWSKSQGEKLVYTRRK